MPKPLFITFEGIDGSGKTTQAEVLHKRLTNHGLPCLLVREPGSTPLGQHLREFLKSQRPVTPMAELLAFLAARAELVKTQILPALQEGTNVISDRYADSSIAYQGGGRKIDTNTIHSLNRVATHHLKPDLTFLMEIDPAQAAGRSTDLQGRFENMDLEFYKRVATAYKEQAARAPNRIQVMDATQPVDRISQKIWVATGVKMTA